MSLPAGLLGLSFSIILKHFSRKNVKHFQEYLAGREESDGLHGKLEMLGEYSSVDGMNI